jgi:hypothetical protein
MGLFSWFSRGTTCTTHPITRGPNAGGTITICKPKPKPKSTACSCGGKKKRRR